MIHLITLSGNSKRFTDNGYPHKAVADINGMSMIGRFVNSFEDFKDYESIFLCREEDLQNYKIENEIRKYCEDARILTVTSNDLGPVYSISQIFSELNDNESILISYIDTLQKTTIKNITEAFSGYEAGVTVHDFKNPHWRSNTNYCLVENDEDLNAINVCEKHLFTEKDFTDANKGGSSGNYFFRKCRAMKEYFNFLMDNDIRVNNEFYVTQAIEYMIKDGIKVKTYKCPYVALGVPEDVEDYVFWNRWFNDSNSA
jgi:bifunctional N-acetylglucosamine-1-phosphate-uridyltransferase/glucosamine-1-phosphate-acetyltransferase GlmU-like protein